MRIFLLSAGMAASLYAGAAQSADLPIARYPSTIPFPVPPAFTWTGFHVGLNAGAALAGSDRARYSEGQGFIGLATGALAAFERKREQVGFVGGGQLGYDVQMGSVVLGAETDLQYTDLQRRRIGTGAFTGVPNGFSDTDRLAARTRFDYLGTARVRIGVLPTERVMLYATGGLAYGDVSLRTSYADTVTGSGFPAGGIVIPYAGSRSTTQVGYVVGGGVEYAFTDRLSGKIEGLYADLGRIRATAQYVGGGATIPNDTYTVREATRVGLVRAGLNYRFTGI